MSQTGIDQWVTIRGLLCKLDDYNHVKAHPTRSVHGLDDDFSQFREQLRRVEGQLKEHMDGGDLYDKPQQSHR